MPLSALIDHDGWLSTLPVRDSWPGQSAINSSASSRSTSMPRSARAVSTAPSGRWSAIVILLRDETLQGHREREDPQDDDEQGEHPAKSHYFGTSLRWTHTLDALPPPIWV